MNPVSLMHNEFCLHENRIMECNIVEQIREEWNENEMKFDTKEIESSISGR